MMGDYDCAGCGKVIEGSGTDPLHTSPGLWPQMRGVTSHYHPGCYVKIKLANEPRSPAETFRDPPSFGAVDPRDARIAALEKELAEAKAARKEAEDMSVVDRSGCDNALDRMRTASKVCAVMGEALAALGGERDTFRTRAEAAEFQLAEALAKLQASEAAGWAERRLTETRTKERDTAEALAKTRETERFNAIAHYSKQAADAQALQRDAERRAEAAEASLANVRADRERLYEQNANSMVEAGAARNALAEERARCDALVDRIVCAHCGKNIAACVGRYEDMSEEKPACDECCAHGNEDGQCHPLYEDDAARDLAIAILAKRALETKT